MDPYPQNEQKSEKIGGSIFHVWAHNAKNVDAWALRTPPNLFFG